MFPIAHPKTRGNQTVRLFALLLHHDLDVIVTYLPHSISYNFLTTVKGAFYIVSFNTQVSQILIILFFFELTRHQI